MRIFKLHVDPGHAWLEVPYSLLRALGITDDITPFSFRDGALCYQEEDVDACLFLKAYVLSGGTVTAREVTTEGSFIRSLPPYFTGEVSP